jgi:type IV pilus assembly protein PilB
VLTQRLVRVLCPNCRQPFTPREEMLASFIVNPDSAKQFTFYQPKGCLHCNGTGFKGRVALHELLVVNDAIREAIFSHKTSTQIRFIAREQAHLVSMREDGFYKATQGVTTLEEIVRVVFHHESDAGAPRTAEQTIALCEGREPPDWPQGLLEKKPHKVIERAPLEKVPVQVFTADPASAALEGESYRIRFDANTVESETERIADFFEAYRKIKENLGAAIDGEYLGDFSNFIIDTVNRLRTSEGAEFAEFSLHVRDNTDRLFVETLLPQKNPPSPRSSREAGMRQVGYLK